MSADGSTSFPMPFKYTTEQIAEFKQRVILGVSSGLSLRKVCAQDGMPTEGAVRLWTLDDNEFATQYARAREARADARADYIDELTDDVKAGTLDPQAARVIIDAQKWQAGKENSKRYGEKVDHTGRVTFVHEKALGELE